MLNPFYWYSFIWSCFIVLYLMNFSDFTDSINSSVLIFILCTIFIAAIAGYILTRLEYRLSYSTSRFHHPFITYRVSESFTGESAFVTAVVFCITIAFIINYYLQGTIPLLGGAYRHAVDNVHFASADRVPFNSALLVLSLLMAFILSYLAVTRKMRVYYILNVVVILLFIINGNRGYAIDSLVVLGLLIAADVSQKASVQKRLTLLLTLLISGVVLAGLFGALGNIRSGFAWNDNHYALKLGRFNKRFPSVLNQFAWAYMYATTPLANLSLSFENPVDRPDSLGAMVLDFVPQSFKKNMGTDYEPVHLIATYLNACTGYESSVLKAGMMGCIFYFTGTIIYIFCMVWAVSWLGYYVKLMKADLVLIVIIQTFLNPFNDIMFAFTAPAILCLALFRRLTGNKQYRELLAVENNSSRAELVFIHSTDQQSMAKATNQVSSTANQHQECLSVFSAAKNQ